MTATARGPAGRDATLRVHAEAYAKLRSVAEMEHVPLTQYLDGLADREFRRAFWERLNASVERTQRDPAAWANYEAESRSLEGTLLDGLEPGEDWSGVFDGDTPPW